MNILNDMSIRDGGTMGFKTDKGNFYYRNGKLTKKWPCEENKKCLPILTIEFKQAVKNWIGKNKNHSQYEWYTYMIKNKF